jgi:UDPglucose 6-dehydrogenase/GDP-mannose 6-dehydrogenase
MKVSVIGTGYVGLVSGTCLAELGHEVTCVDVDEDKVDRINRAITPIHERGLSELLRTNIGKRLRATTDLCRAIGDTDISLLAVGTPFDGQQIDLSYVQEVSRQIGAALRAKSSYHVVTVKSTVVPGTTDEVVLPILERESGKVAGVDFGVGMNPEFLREGEAIEDFMNPDRIVLGGLDDRTHAMLKELYSPFAGVDILTTSNKTAEMIKYASNSLLATLISFSNEIANLCSDIGDVDVVDVLRGVHLDRRVSPLLPNGKRVRPGITSYLEAGCGFGGSCFPKDVKALIAHGEKFGRDMRLLKAVIQTNEAQPKQLLALLGKHFTTLEGVRVAVLGLAFKPGTDDIRESPSLTVIRRLMAQGADIRAYDPIASEEAQKILGMDGVTYCEDLGQAVGSAQAILLLTRWEEFQQLPDLIGKMHPQPLVVDGRRMLGKTTVDRYEGIGL